MLNISEDSSSFIQPHCSFTPITGFFEIFHPLWKEKRYSTIIFPFSVSECQIWVPKCMTFLKGGSWPYWQQAYLNDQA